MPKRPVNNAFYSELGERWYRDDTHAVALLRREADVKLAYVRDLCAAKGWQRARILDLGAGAGLLANPLAALGHQVTAVDSSQPSLDVAAAHAPRENPPRFLCRDVRELNEDMGTFDVVLLLDFLEHVEDPRSVLAIAARFLAPGGILVFHTFNRTPVAWLLAIKALEVFTRACPKDVHVYHLFIKPTELSAMLSGLGLGMKELRGIRPVLNAGLMQSALTRRLHPAMQFKLTRLKGAGYIGYAAHV